MNSLGVSTMKRVRPGVWMTNGENGRFAADDPKAVAQPESRSFYFVLYFSGLPRMFTASVAPHLQSAPIKHARNGEFGAKAKANHNDKTDSQLGSMTETIPT